MTYDKISSLESINQDKLIEANDFIRNQILG